ncbi:MAG: hypothetical protein ACOH2B_13855 [Burkholderiaceae bacterium]
MGTVIVIAIVIFIGLAIYSGMKQAKALEAAKQLYLDSLSKLKSNPTNADLKQRTLAFGRAYSNLTRDKKGNTVFDEVALMNDINAACAAASVNTVLAQSASLTPTKTIEERLRTLSELKEKGLIESAEHEKRRIEILADI